MHYHFLDDAEFDRRVVEGDFLEHAEYSGRRYGTLRSELEKRTAEGASVVLEIEVQGARQVARHDARRGPHLHRAAVGGDAAHAPDRPRAPTTPEQIERAPAGRQGRARRVRTSSRTSSTTTASTTPPTSSSRSCAPLTRDADGAREAQSRVAARLARGSRRGRRCPRRPRSPRRDRLTRTYRLGSRPAICREVALARAHPRAPERGRGHGAAGRARTIVTWVGRRPSLPEGGVRADRGGLAHVGLQAAAQLRQAHLAAGGPAAAAPSAAGRPHVPRCGSAGVVWTQPSRAVGGPERHRRASKASRRTGLGAGGRRQANVRRPGAIRPDAHEARRVNHAPAVRAPTRARPGDASARRREAQGPQRA